MCRVRPGTIGFGPPPVPRRTSLVPLAFFRAAWTSLTAASQPAVWAARDRVANNRLGIVARPANKLLRERREHSDAYVTVTPFCGPARADRQGAYAARLPLSIPSGT